MKRKMGVNKMRKKSTRIAEENFALNEFVLLLFNEHDTKIALNWAESPPLGGKLKDEHRD